MLCRKRHFDAVVTDLRLPDTSGNVLIHAIRAVSNRTCIVVITGEEGTASDQGAGSRRGHDLFEAH